MTREDAIIDAGRIVNALDADKKFGRVRTEIMVDAFCSLGMLKFDEPKSDLRVEAERMLQELGAQDLTIKPAFTVMEAIKICRSAYTENDAFVLGLEKHGYRIVAK